MILQPCVTPRGNLPYLDFTFASCELTFSLASRLQTRSRIIEPTVIIFKAMGSIAATFNYAAFLARPFHYAFHMCLQHIIDESRSHDLVGMYCIILPPPIILLLRVFVFLPNFDCSSPARMKSKLICKTATNAALCRL